METDGYRIFDRAVGDEVDEGCLFCHEKWTIWVVQEIESGEVISTCHTHKYTAFS